MALELNDDHETLEAALALIDEWELEVDGHDMLPDPELSRSPSTTADDDSDATRDSPASVPSPSPVRATRRRKLSSTDEEGRETAAKQQLSRREELVFLRRRVRALEAELVAHQDATVKEDKETATGTTGLDATWVWQQIATRQREYRRTSELENLQLRLRVQEQLQVAKDLMRVLLRAYRHTDQPGQVEEQSVKRIKLPRHTQRKMTEEAQLRLVDELYGERDAIFAVAPFTGGPPTARTTRMHEHANGEATINVDSSWALPFSVDHITSAFWMYLVRKHEPARWQFEPADHVDDDRDILTAKFESTTTSNGQVCTLLGQFVARCVRSSDDQEPAYIAWHLDSHPVHSAPLSMDGVVVQNQSIMRVVWADQATGSDCAKLSRDTGRISLVQMSQRIQVAFAAAETPARRRRVGALTEFMLTTVPAELSWKQQVLENLLLRSTMPSRPPNASKHSYTSLSLRSHAEKAS